MHESVDLCKTSLSLVCIAVKAVAVVALKLSKSATVTATEFAAVTAVAAPAASFKTSAWTNVFPLTAGIVGAVVAAAVAKTLVS